MATATATLSLPTLISRCISTNAPLHSQRPRFVSSSFPSPSIFTIHGRRFGNVNYALKASTEGLPNDLVEDSKFVPLNTDDPSYGPPALLLLGFDVEEASRDIDVFNKIQQLLKDMEGEFLQIIYGTEDMIPRSLWEAVNTKQPTLQDLKIAKSVPRICFLSGLSGEEMMMFIDAFEETELEPAVFAAMVPNSADKPLQELIEEIMGDHEMLSSKQSTS